MDSAINATQAAEAANHFNPQLDNNRQLLSASTFQSHPISTTSTTSLFFREAKPRGCPSHLSRINPRFETSTHRPIRLALRHLGEGRHLSTTNMENFRSLTPLALSVALLLSAKGVSAHGGHMEKIQEGEYMSADPIVGAMAVRTSRNADRS